MQDLLQNSAQYIFYFLAFLTIMSALMVVLSKNPIHSVLYLILAFFCLSGHYILLNAQFLAAVNVIVYAGAIMVLFLFVIMFLNMRKDDEENTMNWVKLMASLVGIALFVVMLIAYRRTIKEPFNHASFNSQTGMVESLGNVLFRNYLLPFEIVSILLIVAMVGALMLGKREIGERHF